MRKRKIYKPFVRLNFRLDCTESACNHSPSGDGHKRWINNISTEIDFKALLT